MQTPQVITLALAAALALAGAASPAQDFIVAFESPAACNAHDMQRAHLIIKPPGGHDAAGADCTPNCHGTSMGFVSDACLAPLVGNAGRTRMALYGTREGCRTEDHADLVNVIFNLDTCFTKDGEDGLAALSHIGGQAVCSMQMQCGGNDIVLRAFDTEDCTGQPIAAHTAKPEQCVHVPGEGYTRYTCAAAAENSAENSADTTADTTDEWTPAGVLIGVAVVLIILVGIDMARTV